MTRFEQQRHKPPTNLMRPREFVLVCPLMRSNVNLARIVRVAGGCGLNRMIVGGRPKIDRHIARDALDQVRIESRRSLAPVIERLKEDGYRCVGLEQASNAQNLHRYSFARRTALVIGHERLGIEPATLTLMDDLVEIPVYGTPPAYNVATATAMALYEYCRQYPEG
jgi:tRNA G18 (ribose-2'-O)-methylase SpoU